MRNACFIQFIVRSASVTELHSENDFWDDGTEIIGSFLFSPKFPWGDNNTLHENPEHILRLYYIMQPNRDFCFYIFIPNLNPNKNPQ